MVWLKSTLSGSSAPKSGHTPTMANADEPLKAVKCGGVLSLKFGLTDIPDRDA
jgi:hypothetical protein